MIRNCHSWIKPAKKEESWIKEAKEEEEMSVRDRLEANKVEEYFVTVVNRLFAIQKVVEGLKAGVAEERIKLVREGKPFAYQQGVLDLAMDIADYASGLRDFDEEVSIVKDMTAAKDELEGYM